MVIKQVTTCLKLVARALFEALRRPYDKLARYGGEEFACLLPKTELAGASAMAERMRTRVSELNVEHLGSDVDQVVTISLGVACHGADALCHA